MTIAEEVLFKNLIKQMVFNRLDDKGRVLLEGLRAGTIKVDDLEESVRNVFRKVVHGVKWDLACYVELTSRGNIRTDWEAVI